MPAQQITDKLYSWASDVDDGTIRQAAQTSRLPFIAGHVALMPDAHVGMGATVGSVIPTDSAIIPAAVGVDIGCGMIAARTSLTADELPDDLDSVLPHLEKMIPAGVGKGHESVVDAKVLDQLGKPAGTTDLSARQLTKIELQFGTLGSGNHFVEICLDQDEQVWIVLHSGSRGIGNELAQKHIKIARQLMKDEHITLEDKDLAYLTQDTPEFEAYIADMLWAQDYAFASRQVMMRRAQIVLFMSVGQGRVTSEINCHHNFTQQEVHDHRSLWITRKGAIKADVGNFGVIPGSMGTGTYIVRGKGNPLSYNSCSHGAGRRMSRSRAKKELTVESLREAMAGKHWLADRAEALLDEHPDSYKDVEQVMRDQQDLVYVTHTLRQVLNFKGV